MENTGTFSSKLPQPEDCLFYRRGEKAGFKDASELSRQGRVDKTPHYRSLQEAVSTLGPSSRFIFYGVDFGTQQGGF